MKIFVTGGTGFIGSHFLNAAFAAGHTVVAHRRSILSLPRVPLIAEPHWVEGRLSDITGKDCEECEALVHLAAHTANIPYDTLENCIHYNVLEPIALFRAAAAAGIERLVVAGSCFEYGVAGERYEYIPADAPLEPAQSYPASKAAASIAFRALAVELGLQLSIHRRGKYLGKVRQNHDFGRACNALR